MEDNLYNQQHYNKAKRQVKKLKDFYVHLAVYLVINAFILIVHYQGLHQGESLFTFNRLSTAFFWGIGLVAHAASVFIPNIIFGRNWEERKIKKLMDNNKQRWE